MSPIICNSGTVEQLTDKVLQIRLKEFAEITESDAKELINTIYLLDKQPKLVLWDHRKQHSYTYQAIKLLTKTPHIIALGIWVKRGINAISANSFFDFQPIYPIQRFYFKQTAMHWLQSQIATQNDEI